MAASQHPLLVVAEVFPPAVGGSGVLLENVYARIGVDVRVLTHGLSAARRRHGNLEVREIPMATRGWGLLDPRSLWRHVRVARAIRRLSSADQTVHCARALPEGLSARMSGRRYVCWTHGEELASASTSRELRGLMRRVIAGADTIIANSRHSRDLLLAHWGVHSDRVCVVHPGADVERFHPGSDGAELRSGVASAGDLVLLSVGRLQRRKGHDLVIQAVALLRGRFPHVRYVIAGDGPERDRLERLAHDGGVADVVHFVGAVPGEDLPRWFRAADIFVLPNRTEGVDFEGFGIVFLEAAASGLPIVGGASGGAPEAIGGSDYGRCVSGTDAEELASVLTTLIENESLRSALAHAARRRVTTSFSWERAAQVFATEVLKRPT